MITFLLATIGSAAKARIDSNGVDGDEESGSDINY